MEIFGMMKIVATVSTLPWIMDAVTISQTNGLDVWDIGKDLSFAGLVFYLVGYSLPKILAAHQDERREILAARREERAELVASMQAQHREHITEIAEAARRTDDRNTQHTQLLAKIADEHAKSAQSGHEAARSLADEIKTLSQRLA